MDNNRFIVSVFVGALSQLYEALSVEASKQTTCMEIVSCIVERLKLAPGPDEYELAEVVGQECKERSLASDECPVALMLLWPRQVCVPSTVSGKHRTRRNHEICIACYKVTIPQHDTQTDTMFGLNLILILCFDLIEKVQLSLGFNFICFYFSLITSM